MIVEDRIASRPLEDGRIAVAFRGIGWCAMHSDFANFDEDVFVLFKSSPYGSVSHQHADQNAFHVAVGGTALAIPSGYYGPYYGSDHHAEWTRATKGQNAILVDGRGQIIRDHRANGSIVGFEHKKQISYVCGDATPAYMGRLETWVRHLFFIRPGLIVIVDDVKAPQASTFQWLLHAIEEMALDEEAQSLLVAHNGAQMTVQLFSTCGQPLHFSQTDQFDTPYAAGQPPEYEDTRPDQYHFTANTPEEATEARFVAVMVAGVEKQLPQVSTAIDDGYLVVKTEGARGRGQVSVPLTAHTDPGTATWEGPDGEVYDISP
jgi:hypothetical protein